MTDVSVITSLTRRDVARVSLSLLVLHPVSLSLMVAGPLLLAVGAVSGSAAVGRLGAAMAWLLVLIPGWGLLISSYTAYRPGAAPMYEPAEWRFFEAGVDVAQPGRQARAEWGEFTGWRSVSGCLLLHTSPTRYVVIPWRDVGDAQQEGIESLLAEKVGRRKR
jgi:hypothetical protein